MSYLVQTPELVLNHVVGYNSNVNSGLHFFNENTVLYTVGKVIVFQNIDNKNQKFLTCEEVTLITTIAVNPGRKYIAVGDQNPEKPVIFIYDLMNPKKKKQLTVTESVSFSRYEAIAFSPDTKLLAAQGNEPSWTIALWMWQKQQFLHSVSLPANCEIYQISFVPLESNQICCIGKGVCRIYRYFQNAVRFHAAPKHEQKKSYLCHTWLKNQKMAIGTDVGVVIINEGTHFKMEVKVDPNDTNLVDEKTKLIRGDDAEATQPKEISQQPIRCIVTTTRGFACTCGDDAVIMYNRVKDGYRAVRMIKLPQLSEEEEIWRNEISDANAEIITALNFSPVGAHLVAGTSHNQLYCCSLIQADLQMNLQPYFEYLSYPFNFGRIKDVDVAVWKPLIASCTSNNILYIWDYYNYTCEIKKLFSEDVCSLSIHPFGLFLLVGFRNHFDIFLIVLQDLKHIKRFLTTNPCNRCAFSDEGGRFAVAQGNVIQIYFTIELEKIFDLKGHNGMVTSIVWSDNDTMLFSCGTDGALYQWNVYDGYRENENVQKAFKYLSVAAHKSGTSYVISNDRTIKEISHSIITRSFDTKVQFTNNALTFNELMFCGTETGQILSITYPLYDLIQYMEYPAHNNKVVKMKASRDEKSLLSTSEDGDIFIWNILDKNKKISPEAGWILAAEIITTKEELSSKNDRISSLLKEMKKLMEENEYRIKVQKMAQAKTHQDQVEKYLNEIDNLSHKLKESNQENASLLAKHEAVVDNMLTEQMKQLEQKDQAHREKLRVEYNLYEELSQQKGDMMSEYESRLEQLEQRHKSRLLEIEASYEEKLAILTKQLHSAVEENRITKIKTEILVSQVENDADEEITGYRVKYLKQVQEQKRLNIELEAEIDTLRRRVNSLKQKLEEVEDRLKKKENEEEILRLNIKKLQESTERAKDNVREKEHAVMQKEERIRDLGQQNEELKKLNFLLKFDVQEKMRKLRPLEEENDTLHRQSKSLEEKIANFEQNNRNLRCKMRSLQLHVKVIDDERARAKEQVYKQEVQLSRYRVEISRMMGKIQNPNQLKEGIVALYRQHVVSTEASVSPEPERSIFDSYGTHLEHSEAKLQSLRDQMLKEINFHKVNYRKVLKEHSDLIQEINELRKDLSSYRSKLRDFEIYFGISSIDLAESTAVRTKVDEALRVEKEGKRRTEKAILDRDKVIVNQSIEIRKLHNVMRFEEKGCSKQPTRYYSAPLPPIREGTPVDSQELKPDALDGKLEFARDRLLSPDKLEKGMKKELLLELEMNKKIKGIATDNASSDGDSIFDPEDKMKHAKMRGRLSSVSSARSED